MRDLRGGDARRRPRCPRCLLPCLVRRVLSSFLTHRDRGILGPLSLSRPAFSLGRAKSAKMPVGSESSSAVGRSSGARGSQIVLRPHHKTGTFAAFDLFSALCCRKALGANAAAAAACNTDGLCRARGTRYLWTEEALLSYSPSATVVHFVRHPVEMLISAYVYARECNEPYWTNASGLLLPAQSSSSEASTSRRTTDIHIATSKFGRASERHQLSKLLRLAHGETYCSALQRRTVLDGLRAEALRSTISTGSGIRQMLSDHMYLHGLMRANVTFVGRLVEVCNPSIDPRHPATSNATWQRIARALLASSRVAHMLPRFGSKFELHRSKSATPCEVQAMRPIAQRVLAQIAAAAANATRTTTASRRPEWYDALAAIALPDEKRLSTIRTTGAALTTRLPPWTCSEARSRVAAAKCPPAKVERRRDVTR